MDDVKVSSAWKTCPGPSLLFPLFWIDKSVASNLPSSDWLTNTLNQFIRISRILHKDCVESRIARNRGEEVSSAELVFFFLLPDGREDRTQAWSIRLCQANGSETNCKSVLMSVYGVKIVNSKDPTCSKMYFSRRESTIRQAWNWHPSAFFSPSSPELKFHAFRNTAKFNHSAKLGPKSCKKKKKKKKKKTRWK